MMEPDHMFETTDHADQSQLQAREMTSLYEMATALNSAVDLDERLRVVLQHVRRVLDYDACIVNLATLDGKALRVCAGDGEGVDRLLGIEFPVDHGINAWIYREGKPALIADADADPRRLSIQGRTELLRAAVGAPLIADGQAIGTIYAGRHQPHSFSEEHLNFLTIAATQVAAAVQQARLLDQARRRAGEMKILYTISAAMASSLDVEQIVQTIFLEAGRIMDTSTFSVALYDKEGDRIHFSLAYEHGECLEPFTVSLAGREGLAAHVVRSGRPLLIRTPEGLEQERGTLPISPAMKGQQAQSWLGVPIVFQDEVLGVISAESDEPYAFTNRQLRLLTAIANQAGSALQNAQLFADVQRAHQSVAKERDKLALLHHIVANVQSADNLASKLQIIADGMRKLGWGRVSVSLRDADLNMIDVACAGFTPEDEAALRACSLPGSEWKRRFSAEFARFRIGNCYYLPWSDPWVRENVRGVRSRTPEPGVSPAEWAANGGWHPQDLLYIPLYGREKKVVGIIGLDDPEHGFRPTSQSLHMIELFAHEAALAIENAMLLADLKLVNTDLQEMVTAQAHLLHTIEEMLVTVTSASSAEASRGEEEEILHPARKDPTRA
jgi:GAF domain-containing protein